MNSKDKDNKTLHDKLKQFFRINKGKRITFRISRIYRKLHVRCDIYNYIDCLFAGSYKSREEFTLTYDIEKEISPDSPVHHRTKAIKELRDAVLNQQWEDVCIYSYLHLSKKNYRVSIQMYKYKRSDKNNALRLTFFLFVSNNRERLNVYGI